MPSIIIDPDSTSLSERPALVRASNRRRARFAEGCVQLCDSEQAALDAGDPERDLLPALVYGPSSSSEGQRLYYLVRWL